MRIESYIRLLVATSWLAGTSCGSMALTPGADSGEPLAGAALVPPLASAGADREILRGFPAVLDGRNSSHPLGKSVTVSWRQTRGEPVFLSPRGSLTPTFMAPITEQELGFELLVDDGTWQTTDEVTVFVSRAPGRLAPRVRAAADRFLQPGQQAEPTAEDVIPELAGGVETHWERVEPQPAHRPPLVTGDRPAVFRVAGTRDGLSSAPDYLVLYPFDETSSGASAPVSSIEGPSLLEPGEPFMLDAGLSSDPNNDLVRFRWEQTRGDSLLPLSVPGQNDALELVAPAVPQEISLRVFARDALLESTPAELRIVVTATAEAPPVVLPGADTRARSGRTVVLDAQGGRIEAFEAPPSWSFEWTQTYGEPVPLTLDAGGRFASFVAPPAPDELVFAVTAHAGAVSSAPAVTLVSVAPQEDNLPPRVYLSASKSAPLPGERVLISATLVDPEADAISSCSWSAQLQRDGTPLSAPVELLPSSDCAPAAGEPVVELVAPDSGVTVITGLEVCDEYGACGDAEVSVTSQ